MACSFFSTRLAMVDFARTRQAGHPDHRRALALERGACLLVDVHVLQVDVVGAAQREVQHAGTDRVVRQAVDQDEAAGLAVGRVRVEGDRAVEREVAHADLVEVQLLGRQVLQGVDVYLVLRLGDRRADGARAELQQIRAARQHGLVAHPHQGGFELVGDFGRAARAADHIAARDVDLVSERQRDRLAGHRQRQIAVGGDDATDRALAARGLRADAVARLDRAAGDGAGEAAEVEVGAVDPLHRQAEGAAAGVPRRPRPFPGSPSAWVRGTTACARCG
jgi:hypothetical protein